jgi:hypothetical protein
VLEVGRHRLEDGEHQQELLPEEGMWLEDTRGGVEERERPTVATCEPQHREVSGLAGATKELLARSCVALEGLGSGLVAAEEVAGEERPLLGELHIAPLTWLTRGWKGASFFCQWPGSFKR